MYLVTKVGFIFILLLVFGVYATLTAPPFTYFVEATNINNYI